MKNSIQKAFISFGFWTAISRVFGFIRDILLAAAFGAGPVSDAFFVAFKLPNMFRRLVAEGALVQSFIPTFSYVDKNFSKFSYSLIISLWPLRSIFFRIISHCSEFKNFKFITMMSGPYLFIKYWPSIF